MAHHFTTNRLFIYVKVKNNANRAAANCEVKLTVNNKANGCQWLSTNDTKTLLWTNGKPETSIKNKPAEREFCLAFSQERLTQKTIEMIDPVYCGVKKEKVKCIAWVGTERALQRTGFADPDGMCRGEFIVHIDVVMDYGNTIGKNFKITVGNTWHDLDAEMLDDRRTKNQRAKDFILRIYNRLMHRRVLNPAPNQ